MCLQKPESLFDGSRIVFDVMLTASYCVTHCDGLRRRLRRSALA